eukprot:4078658-Pleurochrysis_carterae.AAC.3
MGGTGGGGGSAPTSFSPCIRPCTLARRGRDHELFSLFSLWRRLRLFTTGGAAPQAERRGWGLPALARRLLRILKSCIYSRSCGVVCAFTCSTAPAGSPARRRPLGRGVPRRRSLCARTVRICPLRSRGSCQRAPAMGTESHTPAPMHPSPSRGFPACRSRPGPCQLNPTVFVASVCGGCGAADITQ